MIYLLFTEGYSATEGEGLVRPDVAREAVRLGRQLAALMPREAEIWSLIALMEFQSSRFAARIDAEGLPLTLEQQDHRRWDRSAIARGNEAMAPTSGRGVAPHPYDVSASALSSTRWRTIRRPGGRVAASRRTVAGLSQLTQNAVEILDAREINRDLAFSCRERDLHASVEAVTEPFGNLVEVSAA